MTSEFLSQNAVMALTFGLAIMVGLASRRMERSDHLTLVAIPIIAFPFAIVPGIIAYGFEKNAATYILGASLVVIVATLNYRFQPRTSEAGEKATGKAAVAAAVVKEA